MIDYSKATRNNGIPTKTIKYKLLNMQENLTLSWGRKPTMNCMSIKLRRTENFQVFEKLLDDMIYTYF